MTFLFINIFIYSSYLGLFTNEVSVKLKEIDENEGRQNFTQMIVNEEMQKQSV